MFQQLHMITIILFSIFYNNIIINFLKKKKLKLFSKDRTIITFNTP